MSYQAYTTSDTMRPTSKFATSHNFTKLD